MGCYGKLSTQVKSFSSILRQVANKLPTKISEVSSTIFSLLEIILQAVRTKKKAKVANISQNKSITKKGKQLSKNRTPW